MIRRSVVLPLLALALGPLASAAHAEEGDSEGEALSVHVLTIGPARDSWLALGETAVWIQDQRAGTGVVYDFGAPEPRSGWSALTWLAGRLTNRLSRVSIQEALETYRRQARSVDDQELELPPGARVALRRQLEEKARPENRDYGYDPFLGSGATWVRDAINRASGGRLRAASQGVPTGSTLRQQALPLTRALWPVYLLVDLGQGAAADRPLDQWGRMFVPGELQKTLRHIGRAGSWNDFPLVMSEAAIVVAAAPGEPPSRGSAGWDGRLVLAGLALGTTLALAGRAARGRPSLRIVLGASTGLIGLVLGLLGSALGLGWLFGDQLAARHNENLLQLAPWALVLPALAVRVAAGRSGATRQAFWITAAAAALAGVGLLLKATPWFHQDNLPIIGLFLPTWAGLAAGLRALERR